MSVLARHRPLLRAGQLLVHVADLEGGGAVADRPAGMKRLQLRRDILRQGVILETGLAALGDEPLQIQQLGAEVLHIREIGDVAVSRHVGRARRVGHGREIGVG